MKKMLLVALAVIMAVALVGLAGYAAEKSYQFSGTVKSVSGNTFTVEKSAKEVWTFSTDASTKGTPKQGDKVTVYYKMIATDIEAKPATTSKKPAK